MKARDLKGCIVLPKEGVIPCMTTTAVVKTDGGTGAGNAVKGARSWRSSRPLTAFPAPP